MNNNTTCLVISRYRYRVIALLVCLSCSTNLHASISGWHFSSDLTPAQQQQVKAWVGEVEVGLQRLLGKSPDTYKVHVKTQANASTPVPWAHTAKGPNRAVHLYLDMQFPMEAFRSDWTAAHELTHMLFPYVGEDRWFAEGLASYLQYQVMFAAGHIQWDAAVAKIAERFRRVQSSRVPKHWSVLRHNDNLDQQRDYPRLYWGGAAYFALVDQQLWQTKGIRLTDVIRRYTDCCYSRSRAKAMSLLQRFDQLGETDLFLSNYQREMLSDGTPSTQGLAAWLQQHPPRFTQEPKAKNDLGASQPGFELHYREAGQQGNPLLVFVHGTPGSSQAFEHLLNHPKLQACCHMIAVDRLGFGGSADSGVQPSFDVQADAIAQAFEHNQSPFPAILVGHSLGGSIAANVAMRYPTSVGALLIISSALDPGLSDIRWYHRLANLPLIKHIIPTELHRANEEMLQLKVSLQSMADGWTALAIPVSIIQGDKDRLVPNQNPTFAQDRMRTAEPKVHRFPDDGHFILWERPEFIVEQILSLVQGAARQPAAGDLGSNALAKPQAVYRSRLPNVES